MTKRKLNPCPFCGSEVHIDHIDGEFYMICCDNCNSSTSFAVVFKDGRGRYTTKAEATAAWNRRADDGKQK